MASISDLKPLQDSVTTSLLDVTRKAGQISAEDLSFHRSSSSSLSRNIDAQNARLLQLTQKLLRAASCTESNVALPRLRNGEDLDDHWRGLVDVVDDLLEHADACLDEYTGVIKRSSPITKDVASISANTKEANVRRFSSIPSIPPLPKPQLLFDKQPANHDDTPFKPLLKKKPHSAVNLEESIVLGGKDGFNHPYAPEIENFTYPDAVHTLADPIAYLELDTSKATLVNTKDELNEMLAELRGASEIAIDLEHHDTHSYTGIVCLMQISTRQRDWIVDTLVPWREELQVLNEVFADPKILKVLQGSSRDIIWLQRDLGLYVVGLFDTFHASRALDFPQKSLKYLLQRFCNVTANKKLQLADWRIRPIPKDMLDYARSDTHFLLFIYDNMRNMLLQASMPENDLVTYVLNESRGEALQRYTRPLYDVDRGLGPVGWFGPLAKRAVRFSPQQFSVYRAVHEWRDRTARELDEGLPTVMTQATLFAIAEAMPDTVDALLNPCSYISQALKESASELAKVINDAKDVGKNGPTVADALRQNFEFLPRRRAMQPSIEAQQDQGIAATFKRLNDSGEVDSNSERALVSQFWGNTPKPLVCTASRDLTAFHDALRLVLPLPSIDSLSFSAPGQPVFTESISQLSREASTPNDLNKSPSSSDVFVLKTLGSSSAKQKQFRHMNDEQQTAYVEDEVHGDEQTILNNHVESTKDQAEVSGEQNILKRQIEATRISSDEINSRTHPEPFDYANADSVLQAKPGQNRLDKYAADQRNFNLGAKALNAPRGVKRARKEPGRSFTFKQ